jgi:hypothetical protein
MSRTFLIGGVPTPCESKRNTSDDEVEAACYVYLPILTNVRGQVNADPKAAKAKFLLRAQKDLGRRPCALRYLLGPQ